MMKLQRRWWLALQLAAALLFVGCGTLVPQVDSGARAALAPTGTLRIGVYPGSPTSMMVDASSGKRIGIALDLGKAMANQLAVPFEVVEFRRVAEVLDALKRCAVDFTFTNATAARARDVDFTRPMMQLELGYLVPPASTIAAMADVDQPGRRIGVTAGSSSLGTLTQQFRNATVVPAPSLKAASDMLTQGKLDAFATNKAVLYELSASVPGSRIVDGRWGLETMAIAVPKGRERGMATLQAFAARVHADGTLQRIVEHTGLRGSVKPE
jgi:polar amino acid transport system substrate-binding protein